MVFLIQESTVYCILSKENISTSKIVYLILICKASANTGLGASNQSKINLIVLTYTPEFLYIFIHMFC